MLIAKLTALVLIGQVASGGTNADPTSLVLQLGAPRYAEREAAGSALARIGGTALPALRAARSSTDPEVRTRALGLIQKIEGALLTQPTRLRLDFEDAPLLDVAKSFSQHVGSKVALYPEDLPKWKYQRVTLRAKAPVDFWKAVDQLCEAAGLQYYPNMNAYGTQRDAMFALAEGTMQTITPNSDYGPFRVSLLGLHYQRDLNYAASAPALRIPVRPGNRAPAVRAAVPRPQFNPITNVQFTASLQVAGEPRLSLGQSGPHQVQVIEAVDNKGNSLIPSSSGGPTSLHRMAPYFGAPHGPVIQLQAHLHRPVGAGESIKKLRGLVALAVSSRRPDPLVVPLAAAAGKTFQNAELQLTVHDIRTLPNTHQTNLELSVKATGGGDVLADTRDLDGLNPLVMRRFDPQHLQVEVIDANGQLIPWYQHQTNFDPDASRILVALTNLPRSAAPKELRYYTLTRATVSVPFEFHDIPMP
jgi:hypothetical protein